jgi:NAD(P)H-nitrite reductase large subunit
MLRAHVESSANIGFVFGADVESLEKTGAGFRVTLESGDEFTADLVVAGKGIEPNLGFIVPAQVRVDRGIVVGRTMRTSRRDVYAAGDVAECRNRVTRRVEPVTNWIDACEQGRIAGANLAGHEVTTPGSVAENVTTLFGLPVASIGITRPDETHELADLTYHDEAHGWYRRLFLRDGHVVGAVLLGDISGAGVLRGLISGGSDVGRSPEELLVRPARYADAVRHAVRVPA